MMSFLDEIKDFSFMWRAGKMLPPEKKYF